MSTFRLGGNVCFDTPRSPERIQSTCSGEKERHLRGNLTDRHRVGENRVKTKETRDPHPDVEERELRASRNWRGLDDATHFRATTLTQAEHRVGVCFCRGNVIYTAHGRPLETDCGRLFNHLERNLFGNVK